MALSAGTRFGPYEIQSAARGAGGMGEVYKARDARLDRTSRYDVTAYGQRFLISVPAPATNASPITVVLNWSAGLEK